MAESETGASYRAEIYASGMVAFIVDLPGAIDIQAGLEGQQLDSIVETKQLTEAEFNKIHENTENTEETVIMFDHEAKDFTYIPIADIS